MNYYYMAMRGSLVIGLNTDLDHHLADEILGEAIESCEVHDDQICAGGGRNNAKY